MAVLEVERNGAVVEEDFLADVLRDEEHVCSGSEEAGDELKQRVFLVNVGYGIKVV